MRNFLGFLIALTLLFSFFQSPTFAAGISTSTDVNYSYFANTFKTDFAITLKNTGSNQTVLNYYTIVIPFESVSDVRVTLNGNRLSTTVYKQKNGTELIINFKNQVLKGKTSLKFNIAFNSQSQIDTYWGYAKLRSEISGLNIKKITFTYQNDKPEVSYVDGATKNKLTANSFEFSKINKPSITLNFGSPITFEYTLNKKYLNDSDDSLINEVVIPYSNESQQFIISSITPEPITSRIDGDNNIILGFLVSPKSQIQLDIKGYVTKNNIISEQQYNHWDISNIGYWNLTNQFEKIRVDNYLKSSKQDKTAVGLNNYVADRLQLQKGNSINKNTSFENVLRAGADVAIERKDIAVAEDYVDLLIALLRENSIPSRMVVGFLPKSSAYTTEGEFHSWVEYFDLSAKQWKTLDPLITDIYKVQNKDNVDTNNYINLLVRSELPNSPKLPYLSNGDIFLIPNSNSVSPVFQLENKENIVKNVGNVPVYYSINGVKELILPSQEKTFSQNGDIEIQTFYGEKKVVNLMYSQSIAPSYTKILSEVILFFVFIASLLILNNIYVRIKRHGK